MITLAFSVLVYYFFSQVTQLSGFGGVNNVDLPGLVGDPVQDPAPLYLRRRSPPRCSSSSRCAGSRARRSGCRCRGCATSRRGCARSASTSTATGSSPSAWRRSWRPSPASSRSGTTAASRRGRSTSAQTIDVLIIAVVGGLYRLEGAWAGALAYVLIDNYSREWIARGRQRPRPGSLQHDHRTRLPGHRPRLSERPAGPLGAGGRSPAKTADVGGSRGPPRDRHCQLKGSRGEVFCIQES